MTKQMIILAGGVGSRMGGELPKVLVPVSGRPMIEHLLDQINELKDFLSPVIVIGYKSAQVQKILGKKYSYALQRQQLGTANAVWAANKKVSGTAVLVVYGDMPLITARSLKRIAQSHQSHEAVISMFTTHVPGFTDWYSDFTHFGRIIRDKYNNVVAIKEYADASEKERKILEVNPGI
jgi:bifunctional UDP-N-acetylglucosamine pyrophosphorylase/glucosamine-1-phosphate N-acetyltransferase